MSLLIRDYSLLKDINPIQTTGIFTLGPLWLSHTLLTSLRWHQFPVTHSSHLTQLPISSTPSFIGHMPPTGFLESLFAWKISCRYLWKYSSHRESGWMLKAWRQSVFDCELSNSEVSAHHPCEGSFNFLNTWPGFLWDGIASLRSKNYIHLCWHSRLLESCHMSFDWQYIQLFDC